MNKFKVGDKVLRKGADSEVFARFKKVFGDGPYTVTQVLGEYIQLNLWTALSGDRVPFHHDNFELAVDHSLGAPGDVDAVNSPRHYQFFPDLEAIIVIARSMTQEQFYGYCLGSRLKYRLRAGNKDKLEQDIAKSDKYLELYEQHKGECIDAK